MKLLTKRLPWIVALMIMIASCQNNDDGITPTGSIQLSLNPVITENSGRLEEGDPATVVISINKSDGTTVLDSEEFDVLQFNDAYLIEPIVLEVGTYTVEEFLVLNENNEIIFAAPLEDALLASLVENPLPVSFTITSDEVSDLALEVISTINVDPEDLGYTSLSFQIAPTKNILLSVQTLNSDATAFVFTASELTVSGDGDLLYSRSLGDSINLVRLRTDYNEVTLTVKLDENNSKTAVLNADSIDYHTTVPLNITFTSCNATAPTTIDQDVFAQYSFTGNANDESGNGLEGTLGDGFGGSEPVLTTDRLGQNNSAYEFDGTDYIDLSESSQFNFANHSNFSISVWFDPTSVNTDDVQYVVGKYNSASDNRNWRIDVYNGEIRFYAFDQGGTTSNQLTTSADEDWQNIIVTFDGTNYEMFKNGTSVGTVANTITFKSSSSTTKCVVGAAHHSDGLFDRTFSGKIDDLRFYSRAISAEEIEYLSCQ
ncbi:MAG: LamG domain-containing protein [Cytophagales bacterium]|nr:LamG domain-containing protein [Cytophagales bacterium]